MDLISENPNLISANTTGDLSAVPTWYWILMLVIAIVGIVAMWKIFQKAGKPGWHSIVPFLNAYDEFEIAGYNGWMFLLMFVPIVNIVMFILVVLGIAKNFGKSVGFAIGMIFLSLIFMLILAFDNSTYNKVQ